MRISKLFYTITSVALGILAVLPVLADDTEVFYGTAPATSDSTNPNILFVVDTSGSMTLPVTTRKPYVYGTNYSAGGSCDSSKVYYKLATDTTTLNCSSTQTISKLGFTAYCAPGNSALFGTPPIGFYQDNALQWITRRVSRVNTYQWLPGFNPVSGGGVTYTSTDVACQGDTSGTYPKFGAQSSPTQETTSSTTDNAWTHGTPPTQYIFYSADYVEYLNDNSPGRVIPDGTRLSIVQSAIQAMVGTATTPAALSNVNVGLARYNMGGNGGFIVNAVQALGTGGGTVGTSVGNLHACGDTPLSETLYEAYLYFTGGSVLHGLSDKASNVDQLAISCAYTSTSSAAAARLASPRTGTYKTPIASSCQQNYIVYLTDGLPNADSYDDGSIAALSPNPASCYANTSSMWSALGVTSPPGSSDYTDGSGLCLKALTSYMYNSDLNSSFSGKQNVTTYFIGFGANIGVVGGPAFKYLEDAAVAGGGHAYVASDADTLATALSGVLGSIQQTSATFTSPSVAVNSFNKTQTLEDLYVAMFEPSTTLHWPGNVKKYKLRSNTVGGVSTPMIVGQDTTTSAVDPTTGFFTNAAKDFWQLSSDTGTDLTTKGGAANVLPTPDPSVTTSRDLYTYLGSNHPSSPVLLSTNPITDGNTNITLASLNVPTTTRRTAVINWARGDADGNLSTSGDIRHQMGDPIHSQPAVVIYGSTGATTTDKLNDAVVYTATNDGYLHAFDVLSGIELWSYIPQELLPDLQNLRINPASATKHYSLDGNIRVLKYDVNGNGVVDPSSNDHVFLYVGQARGGEQYYALDVTDKNNPKFMWSLGANRSSATTCTTSNDDLSCIVSKSWSTPVLGRVNVNGATQNSQKLVLIFAGGYDDTEDAPGYCSSCDAHGNGLFIVDAVYGTVLWSKTQTASGAFAKMTHAIPSDVTVLDTDEDGFTDRIYVGDMAGQLWRFDITNGNSVSALVAGGVIASLGAKATGATPAATSNIDNRTFYNAPDVAYFVARGGSNYYNISIGSGDRALPKSNTTVADCFYAIRDYNLSPLTQSAYDSYPVLNDVCETSSTTGLITTDGSTTVALSGTSGWKLRLSTAEKSLAQSTTLNGTVLFTTYLPGVAGTSCGITTGSARAYSVTVTTGLKYFSSALYESFNTTGIPTSVSPLNSKNIIRTDGTPDPPPCTGASCNLCTSGVTILGRCVTFGSKAKTFWQDQGAN